MVFFRTLVLSCLAASATIGLALPAFAQPMSVAPDRATGIYAVNEPVHWTIEWTGKEPAPVTRYILKRGGYTVVDKGEVVFHGTTATLDSRFDGPATLLLEIDWSVAGKPNHVWAGAVAAPSQIKAAAEPPADFDAFWKSKIAELERVPANPKLTSVESGKQGVGYWQISLDNIRGTHVHGQLARPAKGGKLPALLILQWAGVYGLNKSWATDRAAEGWLTLNILPHDLPIDQTEAFYRDQYAGALKDYWSIGNDDRDTSYYLRMYLSCVRAVDYLKSRPDWDGKTIVVLGQSQGGQQTLALAGLCHDVTAALALVPAAGDMLAPEVGRAPGFPSWYFKTTGKDPRKVHAASLYYDPANFAPEIRCPVLVAFGLRDEELSPPSSVLAVINRITAPKEVIVLAHSGHQNENGSQDAFNVRCYDGWLPALRSGRPAPVVRTVLDRSIQP